MLAGRKTPKAVSHVPSNRLNGFDRKVKGCGPFSKNLHLIHTKLTSGNGKVMLVAVSLFDVIGPVMVGPSKFSHGWCGSLVTLPGVSVTLSPAGLNFIYTVPLPALIKDTALAKLW